MQFYSFWERVVYRLICPPCVLLVLCLFVVLVDFQIHFKGKTLVLITPVSDHCYFFSYSQTFLAILLVYIYNKFCICSVMLRIFWSFHNVFSKLVSQSNNLQFKHGISYPLSDLIVLGLTFEIFLALISLSHLIL